MKIQGLAVLLVVCGAIGTWAASPGGWGWWRRPWQKQQTRQEQYDEVTAEAAYEAMVTEASAEAAVDQNMKAEELAMMFREGDPDAAAAALAEIAYNDLGKAAGLLVTIVKKHQSGANCLLGAMARHHLWTATGLLAAIAQSVPGKVTAAKFLASMVWSYRDDTANLLVAMTWSAPRRMVMADLLATMARHQILDAINMLTTMRCSDQWRESATGLLAEMAQSDLWVVANLLATMAQDDLVRSAAVCLLEEMAWRYRWVVVDLMTEMVQRNPEEAACLLKSLIQTELAGRTTEKAEMNRAASDLKAMGQWEAATVLEAMAPMYPPLCAADLLAAMAQRDPGKAAAVLAAMDGETADEVLALMDPGMQLILRPEREMAQAAE